MSVRATLLGPPGLLRGETRLRPAPDKSLALLYYLACRGDWVSRDEVLGLFWPDTPEPQARSTLRQRLTSLRRLEFAEGLDIEGSRLRWAVASDLAEFRAALDSGRLEEAFHAYGGPLLAEFRLSGAPAFEAWLGAERASLHAAWRRLGLALADDLAGRGDYGGAERPLARLCEADPDDEDALARRVAARYLTGERTGALAALERFAEHVRLELGGALTPEAERLAERVRRGEPLAELNPFGSHPNPLPLPPTPFVGRREEAARLAALLAQPEARLVTLWGPGGVGKTRLALEVAAALARQGRAVAFASLAELSAPEAVSAAVAEALGLTLRPGAEPAAQLAAWLRGRELLLILDNCEHVLEGLGWLPKVLERAPGLRVLATSRAALHLRAEQRLELAGLRVEGEDADAATLLADAAERAAGLRPNPAHLAPLCRLVEGLPLALELLAPWLRHLAPETLAARLEAGFDPATALRDAPARQRSMGAAFAHSWALLAPAERAALCRLSVCAGSVSAEAAEQVAGASLEALSSLVDASLLRVSQPGHYAFHPLIRQYAREKLSPAEARRVEAAHARYFLDLAGACYRQTFAAPKDALRRWSSSLPDIRAAWRTALAAGAFDLVRQAAYPQSRLYQHHFRFREALEDFALAAATLRRAGPPNAGALGSILAHQALLSLWGGNGHEGARLAAEALALTESDDVQAQVVALIARGGLRRREEYREALKRAATLPNPERAGLMAEALHWLAFTYQTEGKHAEALRLMQGALELNQAAGDALGALSLQIGVGWAALYGGHLDEAEASLRAAQARLWELDISQRERDVLAPLSRVAYARGRYAEASDLAQAAAERARRQGHASLEAVMLATLGRCESALGRMDAARRAFAAALALDVHESVALEVLVYFAEHLERLGKLGAACTWSALAAAHPETRDWNKAQARALLGRLEQRLSGPAYQDAAARGEGLGQAVSEMLTEAGAED